MTMRKRRFVPRFLLGSYGVARQARGSSGFLGGRLRAEPLGGAFWTLTMWEDGRDVSAFSSSGLHQRLVPLAANWAGEAVFGTWNTDDERLPRWKAVSAKIAEHPNFAPLDDPAPAHREQRVIPAGRFGFDLPIPTSRHGQPRAHRRRRALSRSGESSPAARAGQRTQAVSTATAERWPQRVPSPRP